MGGLLNLYRTHSQLASQYSVKLGACHLYREGDRRSLGLQCFGNDVVGLGFKV